ncbi:MAG: glycosyltransferase [Flavisolibacter sp.]|nr:glycosyltransferase [Flavisolibacter sp.]
MTLSIIIVNYNVKYFLEQCLYSVQKAIAGLAAEVIVVDNHSTDGSLHYLKPKFPFICFMQNESNIGFARACNKGLHIAKGEYILFLNPDTLIAEDTLQRCLRFFQQHTEAGAVGVRMVDGGGNFLKESKRAFPAPLTSLFKLLGLARAFPRSRTFSRYHLGHLEATQNHEVDVLAGAFMMIRRDVLDKTGSFDELFFMYGEDVDLSYRIQKAGYKNYYLAETEIIHFKGESTKRGSLNYVRLFYSAMSLFVKKHYGGSKVTFFTAAIQAAIWMRAFIAALAKFIKWIGLPVIDAVLILFSFWLTKNFWINFIKPNNIYPNYLLRIALPAFTVVYLVVAYYAGLYDKQHKRSYLFRSTFIATGVLLALYALLPEQYRFSRGIVVFGALLATVLISILRWLLVDSGVLSPMADTISQPYILVAGTELEFDEIEIMIKGKNRNDSIIGRLSVGNDIQNAIAPLPEVNTVAAALSAKELILCAGTLSYQQIISFIQTITEPLRLRFHAAGSYSIIGSDSSTSSGETFSAEASYNLAMPGKRRVKRLLDVVVAILLLLLFPLHFLMVRRPLRLLFYCLLILMAKRTWIGYSSRYHQLPALRQSVLTPSGQPITQQLLPPENRFLMDFWYAQNYEPLQDIKLIVKNYLHLSD